MGTTTHYSTRVDQFSLTTIHFKLQYPISAALIAKPATAFLSILKYEELATQATKKEREFICQFTVRAGHHCVFNVAVR